MKEILTAKRKIKFFLISMLTVSIVSAPLVWFNLDVETVTWETRYEQEKQEVQDKLSEIDGELQEVGNTIGELGERKETLKEEIAGLEAEIEKTNSLITDIKLAISQVEWQIDQNERKIETLREQMRRVFREIQKQENTTPLELMLSSENLGDAISRVNSLSKYEVEINRLRDETEQIQVELEENRSMLEGTKQNLEATKALNKSKEDELEILLQKTEGDEAKYQSLLVALAAEEEKYKAEVSKIDKEKEAEAKARADCREKGGAYQADGSCYVAPSGGGGGTTGGGDCAYVNEATDYSGIPQGYFIEPVYGYMTNGFGCKTAYYYGRWWNHDGADIANGVGTKIKAAASGTVIHSGWRNGYGYSVIIKHSVGGRRIYTMYAHLNSSPPVAKNQSVSQGQTVGYMGSTGNSTGPHLHFSIADESYELTGSMNCNKDYGTTYTYCFNPFGGPFDLW